MAKVEFEYKNILEIPLTGTDLQFPTLPLESARVVYGSPLPRETTFGKANLFP